VTLRASARRVLRVSGFLAATPTLLGAYAAHDAIVHGGEALRDRWVGAWCDVMLRTFGIRVVVVGDIPKTRARLVVSNHRGVADVIVLWRILGGHMVSRADLSRWPLIGLAGRRLGTVFVDRSNTRSGAGAIRAVRNLLRDGASVTIFPEGTTYEGDEVRPFHSGGLAAVIGTGAAIVPVGLAYSRKSQAAFLDESFMEHLSRMAGAPPSFVVASVGRAIEVPANARAAALAETARAAVAAEVGRARKEADRLDQPPPTM
jgi:1-acyl-sn-glycerol-3-phosphate acyltransferase